MRNLCNLASLSKRVYSLMGKYCSEDQYINALIMICSDSQIGAHANRLSRISCNPISQSSKLAEQWINDTFQRQL